MEIRRNRFSMDEMGRMVGDFIAVKLFEIDLGALKLFRLNL